MRLKKVRKDNKMTQAQVADYLGIPLRTYQNYEREINDPDSDILCKLADLYDVTLDYLMELSNVPNPSKTEAFILSQQDRQLLTLFHQMTDEDKISFLSIASSLAIAGEQKKETHSRVQSVLG